VALAAAVLAGCGEAKDEAATDGAVQDWMNRTGSEAQALSPMSKAMGFDDADKMTETFREQSKSQQQAMVDCMREQGFEYIAFDQFGSTDMGDMDPFGGLTLVEYTKKWGYGIATTTGPDGSTVDDAPGASSFDQDTMPTDPNQKIVESLAPEEQDAYQKALYGDMSAMMPGSLLPDPDGGDGSNLDEGDAGEPSSDASSGEITMDEMPDFSQMGCSGKAMSAQTGMANGDFEELNKSEEELQARVDADPKVKASARAFRTCMKGAGFPEVKAPDEAQNLVSERMNKVWGDGGMESPTTMAGDEGSGSELDSGDGSGLGGGDLGSGSSDGSDSGAPDSGIDKAELKKVQAYELELANAELPCLAAFQVVAERVRFAAEEQFIKDNPDLIIKMQEAFS